MDARIRSTIAVLRKKCPTGLPVHVIMQVSKADEKRGYLGYTIKTRGRYSIHLLPDQDVQATIEHLVHEWAHCMSWSISEQTKHPDHGPHFGISYAEAYRVVYDD